MSRLTNHATVDRIGLTRRQREVATLVARGLSNGEIAEELVVTPGTVANHIDATRRRLRVHSRAAVAAWAIENGLGPVQDRLLSTLERLLEIEAARLNAVLEEAATLISEALPAEKVDAFLYESASDSLVALGTSRTSLGAKQHVLGLARLALRDGGLTVETYRTRTPYLDGRADRNPGELLAIRKRLGIRSSMAVPLAVGDDHRGVLLACSLAPDAFSLRDLQFLQAVARGVGSIAHRAELVEQLGRRATAQ